MEPVSLLLVGTLVIVAGALVVLLRRGVRRSTGPTVALRITPHAAERMAQRRIAEGDVARVVADPDRVIETSYTDLGASDGPMERDSIRLEKDVGGRALKVWVPTDWRSTQPVAVKSVAAQYAAVFAIPRRGVGAVIGRGGESIRRLEELYGVRITVDGAAGLVRIVGDDGRGVARAKRRIRSLAGR
jgi:hypothetical protein